MKIELPTRGVIVVPINSKVFAGRFMPALSSVRLLALCLICSNTPAQAVDVVDDVGPYGSITVTRQVREAVKAAKQGQWSAAEAAYKNAINLDSKAGDLNYGLYNAAVNSNDWLQATRSLEDIFQIEPEAKPHLLAEYGQCLASTGRLEEAVPVLKKALATADRDVAFLPGKLRAHTAKAETVVKPVSRPLTAEELTKIENEVKVFRPEPIPYVDPEGLKYTKSTKALTYENAYKYSEFIGICTYQGYDKTDGITYYHPPVARFRIDKILKGPNLNKAMPVRFEFHDKSDGEPEKGWKFGLDKMPAVGSKWLLFTEMAIPTNGAFETYRGNFGRQEANEENLNKVYKVMELHRGQQ
ncbi:hypothetical protein BH11CYA1_BH11CYA1_32400 [soil metagenome]